MTEKKAEIARTALLELLGRVAHDLRGPAGITSGVLDELESRAEKNGPDASLYAMARRGLAGVLRIAERLEMVAQLETIGMHAEKSPVDFTDLVKTAVAEAAVIQKRKAIVPVLDVADGLKVEGDAHWLKASVVEIVANAIKHAKTSVIVTARVASGKTSLVVLDDGTGITDDAVAFIGVPRFTRTGHKAGLGLSLSIARQVAEAHGGSLTLARRADVPHGTRALLAL
ncbi:MAG: HAMP domain-containing sensor histidine kinase [Polyangiaceae bacterium]